MDYSSLLSSLKNQCSEKMSDYFILTERHIQAVWLEQKYFSGLVIDSGETIRVLSPGIWNAEAGPDFLKAHLYIGDQEYRGDIEIHLQDENWFHHRHFEDERYNNVVLHVSLWPAKTPKQIIKNNGVLVPRAYLEPFLTVPLSSLVQLIDTDLYPYQKFIGSGQGAESLFKELPEEKIKKLFNSAAEWRLQQKKMYLQHRFPAVAFQFAAGICMALGYKQNTENFIELFSALLPYRDLPQQELIAIALGMCGFFEKGANPKWQASSYYHYLKVCWEGKREGVVHQTSLKLHHIRPLNHPIRRLVYMIKLLQDPYLERLWELMLDEWEWMARSPGLSLASWRDQLLSLIPSYEDFYWNSHYLFEEEPKKEFIPLIGKELKKEIVVNTFLPLLYAELKQKNRSLIGSFFDFYQNLKGSKAGKTRYLTHRLFGDGVKGQLLDKAVIEQGVYQLHKDFCTHYEASCKGCPFVERYVNLKSG